MSAEVVVLPGGPKPKSPPLADEKHPLDEKHELKSKYVNYLLRYSSVFRCLPLIRLTFCFSLHDWFVLCLAFSSHSFFLASSFVFCAPSQLVLD